eukprot:1395165-Amorphochlora_amoeboformis.AAC.2
MVTISFVLALSLCISQIVVPVNGGIPVRSRIPLTRTPILFSTRAKCNRPFFGMKSEIEDNLRSSRRPLDNHVESYSSSTGRGQAAPQMRPKRDPLKNHPVRTYVNTPNPTFHLHHIFPLPQHALQIP